MEPHSCPSCISLLDAPGRMCKPGVASWSCLLARKRLYFPCGALRYGEGLEGKAVQSALGLARRWGKEEDSSGRQPLCHSATGQLPCLPPQGAGGEHPRSFVCSSVLLCPHGATPAARCNSGCTMTFRLGGERPTGDVHSCSKDRQVDFKGLMRDSWSLINSGMN